MVEARQCTGRADGCEKDQVELQSKRSVIYGEQKESLLVKVTVRKQAEIYAI